MDMTELCRRKLIASDVALRPVGAAVAHYACMGVRTSGLCAPLPPLPLPGHTQSFDAPCPCCYCAVDAGGKRSGDEKEVQAEKEREKWREKEKEEKETKENDERKEDSAHREECVVESGVEGSAEEEEEEKEEKEEKDEKEGDTEEEKEGEQDASEGIEALDLDEKPTEGKEESNEEETETEPRKEEAEEEEGEEKGSVEEEEPAEKDDVKGADEANDKVGDDKAVDLVLTGPRGATRAPSTTMAAVNRLSVALSAENSPIRRLPDICRTSFYAPAKATQDVRVGNEGGTEEDAGRGARQGSGGVDLLSVSQLHRHVEKLAAPEGGGGRVRALRNRQRVSSISMNAEDMRDWNGEFQLLRDQYRSEARANAKKDALHTMEEAEQLWQEFERTATAVARKIIRERKRKEEERTIAVLDTGDGGAAGERYFHAGIFYTLCVASDSFATEELAQKAARCEFRALQDVIRLFALPEYAYCDSNGQAAPKSPNPGRGPRMAANGEREGEEEVRESMTVAYQMSVEVNWAGQRVVATSALPIDDDTLVYSHFYFYGAEKAKLRSRKRTSTPHYVQEPGQGSKAVQQMLEKLATEMNVKRVAGEQVSDLEVYRGTDGKYYLVHASLLPPTYSTPLGGEARTCKRERRQGELLAYRMRQNFVLQYPKPLPSSLAGLSAVAATDSMELARATTILEEQVVPAVAERILGQCSDCALDSIEWSHVMHVAGLNVRHLGLVRHHMDLSRQHLRGWLLLEMIVRVVKCELHALFRQLDDVSSASLSRAAAGYLNKLLGNFLGSQAYRKKELKEKLQAKFRQCALDEFEEDEEVDLLTLDYLPTNLLLERLNDHKVVQVSVAVRKRLAFMALPFLLPSVAVLTAEDISCPPLCTPSSHLNLEKALLCAAIPVTQADKPHRPWESSLYGLAALAPLLALEPSNWHPHNLQATILIRLARWYGETLGASHLDERLHCLQMAVEHAGIACQLSPRNPIVLTNYAVALHRCADVLSGLLPSVLDAGDMSLVPRWFLEVQQLLATSALAFFHVLMSHPTWHSAVVGWTQVVDQQLRMCATETLQDILHVARPVAQELVAHLRAMRSHLSAPFDRSLAALHQGSHGRPIATPASLQKSLEGLLKCFSVEHTTTSQQVVVISSLQQQRMRYQTSIASETVPPSCWLIFCDRTASALLCRQQAAEMGRLFVQLAPDTSEKEVTASVRRLLRMEDVSRNPVSSMHSWLEELGTYCLTSSEAPAFRSMAMILMLDLIKVAALTAVPGEDSREKAAMEMFKQLCQSLGSVTLTYCECYGIATDEEFISSLMQEEETKREVEKERKKKETLRKAEEEKDEKERREETMRDDCPSSPGGTPWRSRKPVEQTKREEAEQTAKVEEVTGEERAAGAALDTVDRAGILCQGMVVKQGSGRGVFGRHNWKGRQLVLTANCLRYYAPDGMCLGVIDHLARSVSGVTCEFSKRGYAIRLSMADSNRQQFTFTVASAQERDKWLNALRDALPQLPR